MIPLMDEIDRLVYLVLVLNHTDYAVHLSLLKILIKRKNKHFNSKS